MMSRDSERTSRNSMSSSESDTPAAAALAITESVIASAAVACNNTMAWSLQLAKYRVERHEHVGEAGRDVQRQVHDFGSLHKRPKLQCHAMSSSPQGVAHFEHQQAY